jgi:hypothetical protein
MTLLELLAELHYRHVRMAKGENERIRCNFPKGMLSKNLESMIKKYRQELLVILSLGPDDEWPFGVTEQAGMTPRQAKHVMAHILNDAHQKCQTRMYWRVLEAGYETHAIEILHCQEHCVEAAIDQRHFNQLWEKCLGDRLRVYSLYGWNSRPQRWREIVPA